MRWLKMSCLPILIALALALSANAESPNPERSGKQGKQTELVQQPAAQQPAPFASANPAYTPADAPTSNSKGNESEGGSVVMLIFVGVSAVATALIAWFNWQLVGVTDEMKKATADAAQAARESVQLSERALSIDRPMVRTESLEMKNFYDNSSNIRVAFRLKNWGKGPAFITGIQGILGVVDTDDIPGAAGEEPPPREFPVELDPLDMITIKVLADILMPEAVSEPLTIGLYLGMIDDDEDRAPRQRVMTPDLYAVLTDPFRESGHAIQFRVLVHYVDVAQNSYWTEFNWEYKPGSDADDRKFVLISYKDSQQRREKKKN